MKKIKQPFLSTRFSEKGKSAKKRIENILDTKPKKIGVVVICAALICACFAAGGIALKKVPATQSSGEKALFYGEINIDELYNAKNPYVGDHIADGKVMKALNIAVDFGNFQTELQTSAEPYGIKLVFENQGVDMEKRAYAMLALIDNLGYVSWGSEGGEEKTLSLNAADESLGESVKSFAKSKKQLLRLFMLLDNNYDYAREITQINVDSAPREAVVIENGKALSWGRLEEFVQEKNASDRLAIIEKNGDWEKRTLITSESAGLSGIVYEKNIISGEERYSPVGEWGNAVLSEKDGTTYFMLLPKEAWLSHAYTVFAADSDYAKDIDTAVGKAVKKQNSNGYLHGEFAAEGHIILKREKIGDEKEKVYAVVSYGEYSFLNGMFVKESGTGAIPAVLVFEKNDSGYFLKSFTYPKDGSKYADSVKKMFPAGLRSKAMNSDKYYKRLLKQEMAEAQEYLKSIGKNAKVGEYADLNVEFADIDTEAANKLLDADKYARFSYPAFLGTRECVISGVRYICEKRFTPKGNGGVAEFITTDENGNVAEYLKYSIDKENVTKED